MSSPRFQASGIPPEPRPGDVIGDYELLARVGRGSTGSVFRARDAAAGRDVAIKVLEPLLSEDLVATHRFDHEVRAARALAHPNIVPILDDGAVGGRRYLVMPWFRRGSLADELTFTGPLAAARLSTVALDVGAGLAAIHAAGLVHRDVKAANVMVGADGHLAVTDLGLARGADYTQVTRPGDVVGTPDYLAPELIRGEPAAPASDIYGFACLVYECVAGEPPFGRRSGLDLVRAHLEQTPRDLLATRGDLTRRVASTLLEGLAKDPAARPADALAFGRQLAAAFAS